MLQTLTDKQIETRLDALEAMIAAERDTKRLAHLNSLFQKLIDEQVRREEAHRRKIDHMRQRGVID